MLNLMKWRLADFLINLGNYGRRMRKPLSEGVRIEEARKLAFVLRQTADSLERGKHIQGDLVLINVGKNWHLDMSLVVRNV